MTVVGLDARNGSNRGERAPSSSPIYDTVGSRVCLPKSEAAGKPLKLVIADCRRTKILFSADLAGEGELS